MTCNIEVGTIAVEKDKVFAFTSFMPENDYKWPKNITKEERDKLYRPEAIIIDGKRMVEVQRITGRFDSAGTVKGSLKLLVCERYQQYFLKDDEELLKGRDWSAEWKGPK